MEAWSFCVPSTRFVFNVACFGHIAKQTFLFLSTSTKQYYEDTFDVENILFPSPHLNKTRYVTRPMRCVTLETTRTTSKASRDGLVVVGTAPLGDLAKRPWFESCAWRDSRSGETCAGAQCMNTKARNTKHENRTRRRVPIVPFGGALAGLTTGMGETSETSHNGARWGLAKPDRAHY